VYSSEETIVQFAGYVKLVMIVESFERRCHCARFVVLSETEDFFYKSDDVFNAKDEIVVRWDDPAIGINWSVANPSLSVRDATAPPLSEVKNLPVYGQI
jgi:dTDP-4-dehydrorhamnose 3,5-epimerase-like enzyme